MVSGNIDIIAHGFPAPEREADVSMTPRFLEFTVITNLTEHFVESRGFIPIVDALASGECNDMVLDFRGQPIPVILY